MEIERDGDTVATVKKALITPLRDRFSIDLEDGGELSAKGNIVDHEYEIERDGHKVAEISKRWFRIRDTYGIEIVPGENDALILAADGLYRRDGPTLAAQPFPIEHPRLPRDSHSSRPRSETGGEDGPVDLVPDSGGGC